MNDDDLTRIRRLIAQTGRGEPPAVRTMRTEIRSNEAFPPQPPPDPGPPVVPQPIDECYLAYMIIEWCFRVSLDSVLEFNQWLRDNEPKLWTIKDQLDGVHYRGTYVEVLNSDGIYRTFWTYQHPDQHRNWSKLSPGEIYDCVKTLRQWWLKDPNRCDRRYQPAHLFVGDPAISGFFKLTLEAARELAGKP